MRVNCFVIPLIVALVLMVPCLVSASDAVHYFDCKECHLSGMTLNELGGNNVCLKCHDLTAGDMTLGSGAPATLDGHTDGRFVSGDASNLFGHGTGQPGADQTSHTWSAPTDNQPAAGAMAPSHSEHPEFYSRYGTSVGKITCTRCHNPHGSSLSNPKLLVKGNDSADDMCLACHAARDQTENHGWMTHPIVPDYNASVLASPEKFKPFPVNRLNADIRLVNGGVSCTSCHGVHFVDSDASTTDGPTQTINTSEGKLLRGDGPGRLEKSSLCQSCHTYAKHGDDTGEKVGCLVCHSGHSYDPEYPNYFVLRKTATTARYNTVVNLDYSSPDVLDLGLKFTFWNDQNDGTADGLCEKCHGDAKDIGLGAGDYHVASAVCTECHKHSGTTDASFSADCNGCHAYPPVWGSHERHINSTQMPELLGCGSCHSTSGHINELSEVRFDSTEPWVTGATYSDPDETSRYTKANVYNSNILNYVSCDNLYCHSNAAPFDKANLYQQPIWGGASVDCASCHDAGGAITGLSGRHDKHTDAGTYAFSCAKCHSATVSDSVTISDAEQHIDMEKDIVFSVGGTYNTTTNDCSSVYCHSDGRGGANTSPPSCASVAVSCHWQDSDNNGSRETDLGDQTSSVPKIPDWTDTSGYGCYSCHKGRPDHVDRTEKDPKNAQMDSNAHFRLANDHWLRQYSCSECHFKTTDELSNLKFADGTHVNETVDVFFGPKSKIPGYPDPTYNTTTMVCENIYCHSDGTKVPQVRDFPWNLGEHAKCDSCHGHESDDDCLACHEDGIPEVDIEDQWKMATPMYENTGAGTERANSHMRHLESEFACENCHRDTVVGSCNTAGCHDGGIPEGAMSEIGHIIPEEHIDTVVDIAFKDGGTYIRESQTCTNTACHGNDAFPKWGESRNGAIICFTCHGTTEEDVDDYGAFNGIKAKINLTEWEESGHGRMAAKGNYPESGNPPANFSGNPCWYCHDNEILHDNVTNPYRLIEHPQFEKRFEKECVYCHMERKDEECWGCHDDPNSLSSDYQLDNLGGINHAQYAGNNDTCLTAGCHLPQEANLCGSCHDNSGDTSGAQQLDDNTVRTNHRGEKYSISEIRVGMSESPYAIDHVEFSASGTRSDVSCMATPEEWPSTGCHTADAHIHNTGAGTWTADQKEDVKNQYVMMGVCLQCHDNDDNNRCNTCHEWPEGDEENNPYRLGYDPGSGFHSGSSKASSTHFGFKHFKDYEDSMAVVDYTGALTKDTVKDRKYEATTITDASQSWIDDELVGKSLQWTSGPLNGVVRPILINRYNSITVNGVLSEVVTSGTTYKVLGTVWKGGKFCWDCHDPHGDSNIYMIQDDVSVTTDGLFGKPLERAAVKFTRTISGLDYANNDVPAGESHDGICNVCHTNVDHFTSDYGDGHRSGRRCTDCHNHGFDEGHGSGESCGGCHEQKPVPNHLGFGQPRDCTKCHDGAIKKRTDIMRQFRGQSHHVQDVEVDNTHCYKCHWEATKDGLINNDYHTGYNYKTHETVSGARNDMVVWEAPVYNASGGLEYDGRPSRYELNNTAILFNTSSIGTADERANVSQVTLHCLGCHSKQHNDSDIFGDCKTPRQYAWDRTSIAERYLDPGTTNWGKYTTFANAAKKIQDKAFSAHGNAVENNRGWDPVTGEDGDLPNGDQGGRNVQCYDCHNSHGSYTEGITSSYQTFDGTYKGANLKETQAGKGGYEVTYQAKAVEAGAGVVNPMNPGAAQCFDCHETEMAGEKPWGYKSTYNSALPIQSYRDSSRFGGGTSGHKERFAYRSGMNTLGGHLQASEPLYNSADTPLNGLCAGCHDPHGVSPSLGDDQVYAVPLLKGTWLTSPYQDDRPFEDADPTNRYGYRQSNLVQLDRKTFGTTDGTSDGPPLSISEDAEKFGGLCLRCHPKESLTDGINKNTAFKTSDRIHEAVKGWGNNAEHSFSCSKCHNAHSSGLGRLMRTNCLNFTHRGQNESGGLPGYYNQSNGMSYPRTAYYYGGVGWLPACHNSAAAGGGAWNDQEWNMVTPW